MKRKLYPIVCGAVLLLAAGCKTKPVVYWNHFDHAGVVFTGNGISGWDYDRKTGKVTSGKLVTQAEIDDLNRMRRELSEREDRLKMKRWLENQP